MRFNCAGLLPNPSRALVAMVVGLMISITSAKPGNNPYSEIVNRNVFALKDPPPPPVPFAPPAPARQAPNLVLTGIADFAAAKWAFVSRADPGQPPKKHTLTLDQTVDGLHLLALDAKHDSATVLVDGSQVVTLHLVGPTNPPVRPMNPPQFSATARRVR